MKLALSLFVLLLAIQAWAGKGKRVPISHLEVSERKCEVPCNVVFDASKSKSVNGLDIVRYYFSFGDGNTYISNSPTFTHVYQSSSVGVIRNGHFKAELKVDVMCNKSLSISPS